MNTIVTDVVQWAVTAGVGSMAVYVTHKGLLGRFAQYLATHAREVEQGAVKVVEAIVDTPAAKAAELHLKSELDKALGDVKQSTLGEYAAQALLATGKKLVDLSPSEVEAIALHIFTQLPSEWKITKAEIVAALELAQKGAEAVLQVPVIQAATRFAEELKAVQQA